MRGSNVGFPNRKYATADEFSDAYIRSLVAALDSVDRTRISDAATILRAAIEADRLILACGNGASGSIANLLTCDGSKGVRTDTHLRPRMFSLSAATELITAIANDVAFEEIFTYQLQNIARAGDVLVTVSCSGDSENIVRAATWARSNGVKVIALTGFSGGRSASLADVNLHVGADNYGIIEDVHQSIAHMLVQFLRQSEMPASLIASRKF